VDRGAKARRLVCLGDLTPAKAWFDRLTTLSNVERAKHAKFWREKIMILKKYLLFSDLCGPFDYALRTCFAGDIPSFGCGDHYEPDKVPTA
jgi:hypothetical protein